MLTKQAIRSNVHVLVNGESITKDQLITISEGWNENQEQFFRKMLQQGGIFTLKGVSYKIKYEDKYGRQLLAAGEEQKVMRTLAKAGYKINIER